MPSRSVLAAVPIRRRDLQKEQTRLDLALAAFELAKAQGLAAVRIPQIAAAVGVSPRTFNNYFPSREAAIVWPTTLRSGRLARGLAGRPAAEPLAVAIVAAVAGLYGEEDMDGLPPGWLQQFRALVAAEPALHGEYLKAAAVAETVLAEAIAARIDAGTEQLRPMVLAAITVAAERAAVLYWVRQDKPTEALVDLVRAAVDMALRGMTAERGAG